MEMKLVPYGAGWTDVHFKIGDDNLYFIITSVWGDQFSRLLEVLYCLHPDQHDPQYVHVVDFWDETPQKIELNWDEEGSSSHWSFLRLPSETEDFQVQIDICIRRDEEKHYSYQVRYQDFCYAVAKTCTEVLKSHGIYGYHHSTYVDDLNLRHLLFVKAVALDCFDARTLTWFEEGLGEGTDFEKELELLLFDM